MSCAAGSTLHACRTLQAPCCMLVLCGFRPTYTSSAACRGALYRPAGCGTPRNATHAIRARVACGFTGCIRACAPFACAPKCLQPSVQGVHGGGRSGMAAAPSPRERGVWRLVAPCNPPRERAAMRHGVRLSTVELARCRGGAQSRGDGWRTRYGGGAEAKKVEACGAEDSDKAEFTLRNFVTVPLGTLPSRPPQARRRRTGSHLLPSVRPLWRVWLSPTSNA